jgi:hypothetical protein
MTYFNGHQLTSWARRGCSSTPAGLTEDRFRLPFPACEHLHHLTSCASLLPCTPASPRTRAAACVCRHWRDVCRDLETRAKLAAAAAASRAGHEAAAEASVAAARALRACGSTAAAAFHSGTPTAAATTAPPAVATGPAPEGRRGGGPQGASTDASGGLWGCLDVRSRPSVRFEDAVVHAGLASRRWTQVRAGAGEAVVCERCTGPADGLTGGV